MKLKQLLAKEFDLFCQRNWLRHIDKEVNRRNKYLELYNRQVYVISALVGRYNELYPNSKLKVSQKERDNT